MLSGARLGPDAERSAFGALSAFAVTVVVARAINSILERERPATRPRALARRIWRAPGGKHSRVHHFVPGIGLTLLSGGAAILRAGDRTGMALSVAHGTGTALVLDELAVMLQRRDAYWRSEKLAFAQGGVAGLAAAVLAGRFYRRGMRAGRRPDQATPLR